MENDRPRRRLRLRLRLRRFWPLALPCLLAVAWLAWSVVAYATSLRAYAIPSGSMSPTITAGDRVCVDTSRRTPPRRGEVWVIAVPTGSRFIKRVVGLPGETVAVTGGQVVIDGRPLTESYLTGPIRYTMPAVRLGPNEYFVLGDNRNTSQDSHVFGPVPGQHFIGRALYRYWPMGRVGSLR
jgi:signal peptidase I